MAVPAERPHLPEQFVQKFAELFRGRQDVRGALEGRAVKEALEPKHYKSHLLGYESLGVYPLLPDSTVWFAAIDIDEPGEAGLAAAVRLRDQLDAWGLPAYIETSKSKGYHVWLFFSAPVPAKKARGVLIAGWNEATGSKPLPEIFPKQAEASRVRYGNYIHLPYWPDSVKTGRRVMLDLAGQPMTLERFLDTVERVAPDTLAAVYSQHEIPETTPATRTNIRPFKNDLLPCARQFIAAGVDEGARDTSLFRLAVHLHRNNYPQEVALAVLHETNSRCTPPLDTQTVEQKLQSAYSGAAGRGYRALGCEDPQWTVFCPGRDQCPVWTKKPEDTPVPTPPEEFSIAPLEVPRPYVLTAQGVYIRKVVQGDEELVPLTTSPLWVAGRGEEIHSGRVFLQLRYRHDRERSEWVSRAAALNARQLVDLADFGVPVNSATASQIVRYLDAFEARNIARFETEILSAANGWIDDSTFLAGTSLGERQIRLHPEGAGDHAIVEGFQASGTFTDWLALAADVRQASPVARFGLAAAFAGPLLRPLKQRSFIVHLWYESGAGKSAVIKLAVSAWGDPERLMASLYATRVGVERLAALFSDLLLGLDELQLQDNIEFRRALSYLLAQGTGKTRGAKGGGLQSTPTWRLVTLTSGEVPMTTSRDFSGQQARVLDIYGEPIADKTLSQRVHQQVQDLHGTAGPAFASRLLFENHEHLRTRHAQLRYKLAESLGDQLRTAHLDSIAVVVLADALVSEWFYELTRRESEDQALAVGRDIANRISGAERQASYAERALEWTLSWVAQHEEYFREGGREVYGRWGGSSVWRSHPEELVLLPSAWEPAIQAAGFDPDRVLQDWAERRWIAVEGRNLRVKRDMGENGRVRAIVLLTREEWFK